MRVSPYSSKNKEMLSFIHNKTHLQFSYCCYVLNVLLYFIQLRKKSNNLLAVYEAASVSFNDNAISQKLPYYNPPGISVGNRYTYRTVSALLFILALSPIMYVCASPNYQLTNHTLSNQTSFLHIYNCICI